MSRLILGTVQFGLDYGAANQGQVAVDTVAAILDQALQLGIDTLDTATAYGTSEAVLGELKAAARFRIITKLAPQLEQSRPLLDQFNERVERLAEPPDTVLFHRASDLLDNQGEQRWQQASQARDQGLCAKLGVSVYHPAELEQLLDRYSLAVVQLPANWLDRRFLSPELLARLNQDGVEIHARSLLLQGVLVQPPAARAPYFDQFAALAAYDQWAARQELTPLACAMGLLHHYPQLQGVVGCVTPQQLVELDAALATWPASAPNLPAAADELILPYLWPPLRN